MGRLAFSPDDRLIAAVDREQVQVWHALTGHQVLVLRGAPPRRGDNGFNPRVAWSPDGQLLAALNHDGSISVWDGTDDEPLADRFRASERRAFAWHLVHAQHAIQDSRLNSAARFHLEAITKHAPPNDDLRVEYGRLLAQLGSWQAAIDEYGHARSAWHSRPGRYEFEDAVLRLRVGDVVTPTRVRP